MKPEPMPWRGIWPGLRNAVRACWPWLVAMCTTLGLQPCSSRCQARIQEDCLATACGGVQQLRLAPGSQAVPAKIGCAAEVAGCAVHCSVAHGHRYEHCDHAPALHAIPRATICMPDPSCASTFILGNPSAPGTVIHHTAHLQRAHQQATGCLQLSARACPLHGPAVC